MAGSYDTEGNYSKGIEDYLPNSQYETEEHQKKVVEDILTDWLTLSHNGKFHALFATTSIPEAIAYYRLIKQANPAFKITALFDPNINNDNPDGAGYKEDGLVEIIKDYNQRYNMTFKLDSHDRFKKDIAARLAHKDQYKLLERTPDDQLELLIVVNQMLTGFDSKWINTLYMDKIIEYENIIQAFSRTNRLFGPEKPFGTIRYYRRPHTMEQKINAAVKLYSGNKPLALFASKLEQNLTKLNSLFDEISIVFHNAGISNFEKVPEETAERAKFVSLFNEFNDYLEAVKIQGFKWENAEKLGMHLDENTYLILALRYKELASSGGGGGISGVPFDITGHLTQIDTGRIDSDYMNSRFDKYLKILHTPGSSEELEEALNNLHKTFGILTAEDQKYANLFLHDIQSGDVQVEEGKTLRDYITEYQSQAKNDQIHKLADVLGLDEKKLRTLMNLSVTTANINEYNRFNDLLDTVDKAKARAYFEKIEGSTIPQFKVNIKVDELLRNFVLSGDFPQKDNNSYNLAAEPDPPYGIST
jgi:type I restriction enzyme R subunit